MELQEFITATLLDITSGVEEANKKSNRFKLFGVVHANGASGETVEFDIGLEVGSAKEKGGKGGISVASVGLSGEAKSQENRHQVNRLKFKVFVTEK